MAVGDNITALRFNALQTRIAAIMGSGSGQTGYGQTLTSGNAQVATGNTITAAAMNAMIADMQKARQHQTGTDQSSSFPQVTTSTTITEAYYANLESQMTTIENNKFSIGDSGTAQSTTSTLSSSSRTTAWDATLTHSVAIDFGSASAARYFFNAGGKLNTRASLSGYTGTASTDWFNLITGAGTVSMSHTDTTCSGSGTTTTIGFYDLTNVNQQIFTKVGSTYTNNNYTVFARCDVANNTTGTARYVYIDVKFNDADPLNTSAITGTITSFVEALTPTGTNVSLTAPTGTATANLADAAVPADYSITVRGGQTTVTEGNQVIFDVTTTTGETTLYWTTTGTVSAADFSDNTLSGTVTMVNGTGAISRTLIVEGAQYTLTPSTTSVNEGSTVTITVDTTNVVNGTTLYWGTTSVSGTVNASDFADGVLVGSVTINSNTATITRQIASDLSFNEGSESFTIKLYTDSARTTTVATTSTITINDTSAKTYTVSASTTSVNEGSSVTFTVTTTNVSNGTIIYWDTLSTVGTLNNSDFNDGTTTGSFSISSNSGTVSRTLSNDATTEGNESFILRFYSDAGRTTQVASSPTVTVADTSVAPPPTTSVPPPTTSVPPPTTSAPPPTTSAPPPTTSAPPPIVAPSGVFERSYVSQTGSWTVPANVYSIHVLVIGAGGQGAGGSNGGGGGGVSWKNDIPVTPGTVLKYKTGVPGTSQNPNAAAGVWEGTGTLADATSGLIGYGGETLLAQYYNRGALGGTGWGAGIGTGSQVSTGGKAGPVRQLDVAGRFVDQAGGGGAGGRFSFATGGNGGYSVVTAPVTYEIFNATAGGSGAGGGGGGGFLAGGGGGGVSSFAGGYGGRNGAAGVNGDMDGPGGYGTGGQGNCGGGDGASGNASPPGAGGWQGGGGGSVDGGFAGYQGGSGSIRIAWGAANRY